MAALMFPFEQSLQASAGVFVTNVWLFNGIVAAVLGLSLGLLLLRAPHRVQGTFTFTTMAVCILYAWAAISIMWTPSSMTAPILVRGGLPYVILLVLITPALIDSTDALASFLRSSLVLGTGVACLMAVNPDLDFRSGRLGLKLAVGVQSNPLAIGELGGLLVLLSTLVHRGAHGPLLSLMRPLALLVGALLCLQSGSRGQLIFAVALAVFLTPLSRKMRNPMQFVGGAVVAMILIPIGIWLIVPLIDPTLLKRWDADQITSGVAGRFQNILDLFAVWLRSPSTWIPGLGMNAFASLTTAGSKEGYVHNIFVEVLTEFGLPMFLLFCWLILATIQRVRGMLVYFSDDPEARASVVCIGAFAAYYLAIANKQGELWSQGPLFMYICIIARLSDGYRNVPEREVQPETQDDEVSKAEGRDRMSAVVSEVRL